MNQNSYMEKSRSFVTRHRNVLVFMGGFLFDFVTMIRIDSWTDLGIQLFYLSGITFLLVYQYREVRGVWTPPALVARLWHYNIEILHFFYGGLLSAYVVLYLKSSSGARPIVFFLLLAALMGINEMPMIRRFGHRLRLGLFAFCVASFLIYFVPIILGFMGWFTFVLSLAGAGYLVWKIAGLLASTEDDRKAVQMRLFRPAAAVLIVILALYALRLIPPVPLSVQYEGIYHRVEREDGHYALSTPKPPLYLFWKRDSRPFRAQPGDQVFFFVRVFAPARFRHQVMIRWEMKLEKSGKYVTTDRIPLQVTGGRSKGYRGFAIKSHFETGHWRVSTETEDGRTISVLPFRVVPDTSTKERTWRVTQM